MSTDGPTAEPAQRFLQPAPLRWSQLVGSVGPTARGSSASPRPLATLPQSGPRAARGARSRQHAADIGELE